MFHRLSRTEAEAKRFEDFDPDHADDHPVEEYTVQRAVVARAQSERLLIEHRNQRPHRCVVLAQDRCPARHLGPGRPTAPSKPPESTLKPESHSARMNTQEGAIRSG
jgi:hypothetical protein